MEDTHVLYLASMLVSAFIYHILFYIEEALTRYALNLPNVFGREYNLRHSDSMLGYSLRNNYKTTIG